jgi:YfiH family protein
MIVESPSLAAAAPVRHAFFTRRGGVSEGPWASLNMGLKSGDDPARVGRNRAIAAEALGVPAEHLLTLRQVHGKVALRVCQGVPPAALPEGDALVTTVPGLAIGVLSADCAPILLADPEAGVVGAAHAGWRGAIGGVIEAVVAAMVDAGAEPGRISAAVGPCISRRSYEVGDEFRARLEADDPECDRFFTENGRTGRPHFDLEGYAALRLARAGVGAVETLGRDTCAEADAFFSWRRLRREGGERLGLQLSAIALAR